MKINFQTKNIELTTKLQDYVVKKITNLGKLLSKMEDKGEEVKVRFDLTKTTKRHKNGEVYRADCSIVIKGKKFFSSIDAEDLYQAVDGVKSNLFNEIGKNKDRKQTLYKRGATSVKKMMKGLSKRNPLTAKY